MPRAPKFHNAERVDLPDFTHATETHPVGLRDNLIDLVLGNGVYQGFRAEVPANQINANKGMVTIFNGVVGTWGGRMINAETGDVSQSFPLRGSSTEFWIEVEFMWIEDSFDGRTVYDSTKANVSPLPNGQEVDIARMSTRLTPGWRIKHPIRQNPAGSRSTPGYAPQGFSSDDPNVMPLMVLRTNSQGQIVFGNPNSDSTGNDLTTISLAGGSRQVIPVIGYGEHETRQVGGKTVRIGRKATDQRPRVFERLEAPMRYGDTGEIIGDTESDHWARDLKSVYDHLATQMARVVLGLETQTPTENGVSVAGAEYYEGVLIDVDPDWRWVKVTSMSVETLVNPDIMPDDWANWTFQIRSGPWNGFYAQVHRQEKKDGSGHYKLWLHQQSYRPDWWPLPNAAADTPAIRLVNGRRRNWAALPMPNSGNRGLNALDDEVVGARNDIFTQLALPSLRDALSSQKSYDMTFSPVRAQIGGGGVTAPVFADVVVDNTDVATMQSAATAWQNMVLNWNSPQQGGRMLFRKGLYDFALLGGVPTHTVFTTAGQGSSGWLFQGEGMDTTTLKMTTAATSQDHILFDLTNCSEMTFRDMTIHGKGRVFNASGCSNIRFENCKFVAEYDDVTSARPALDLGAMTGFEFHGCVFELSGQGVKGTTASEMVVKDCRFSEVSGNTVTEVSGYWWNTGVVSDSRFEDCLFTGPASLVGMRFQSNITTSVLRNVQVRCEVDAASVEGLIAFEAGFLKSRMEGCLLGEAGGSASPRGISGGGSMADSTISDTLIEAVSGVGILLGSLLDSDLSGVRIKCSGTRPAGSVGLSAGQMDRSTISAMTVLSFETGILCVGTSEYNNISSSIIREVEFGIDFHVLGSHSTGCQFNKFTDNTIHGFGIASGVGIRIESSFSNTCAGNNIYNFQYGITSNGDSSFGSQGIVLTGNRCVTTESGYLVEYTIDSVVTGNSAAVATTSGFSFSNSVNIVCSGNHVEGVATNYPYWLGGISNPNWAENVRGGMLSAKAGGTWIMDATVNNNSVLAGDLGNGNMVIFYNTWDGVFPAAKIDDLIL